MGVSTILAVTVAISLGSLDVLQHYPHQRLLNERLNLEETTLSNLEVVANNNEGVCAPLWYASENTFLEKIVACNSRVLSISTITRPNPEKNIVQSPGDVARYKSFRATMVQLNSFFISTVSFLQERI